MVDCIFEGHGWLAALLMGMCILFNRIELIKNGACSHHKDVKGLGCCDALGLRWVGVHCFMFRGHHLMGGGRPCDL